MPRGGGGVTLPALLATRTLRAFPVLIAIVLVASRLAALPDPDEPVDPAKRAPISTRDAVRPGGSQPTDRGVVGEGRIPVTRARVPAASKAASKRTVNPSETRPKCVRQVPVRAMTGAREASSLRVAALPGSIPRLEAGQFKRILMGYRAGRTRAADLRHVPARHARDAIDLAAVNRFANPRATLEQQGIPVVPAGSRPAEDTSQTTVPLSGKDTTTRNDATER